MVDHFIYEVTNTRLCPKIVYYNNGNMSECLKENVFDSI